MIRPRFLARLRARRRGWFWLPCPRCGRMFAGFEGTGSPVPKPGKHLSSLSACSRCVVPAAELLAEQEKAWGCSLLTMEEWAEIEAARP